MSAFTDAMTPPDLLLLAQYLVTASHDTGLLSYYHEWRTNYVLSAGIRAMDVPPAKPYNDAIAGQAGWCELCRRVLQHRHGESESASGNHFRTSSSEFTRIHTGAYVDTHFVTRNHGTGT